MQVFLLIQENGDNLASEVLRAFSNQEDALRARAMFRENNPEHFFEVQALDLE